MTTKKRELRKAFQSILDGYGVLCTISWEQELCDVLADSAFSLLVRKRAPRKKPSVSLFPIAEALGKVCVVDFASNKAKLFAEAKRLSRATPPPTKSLILTHYDQGGTWYREDWRGREGNPPVLGQVRLTWAKLVNRPQGASGTFSIEV